MKLSIAVVNHNQCKLLRQSINSLIDACDAIDYELIIVDNASTDGSLEMIGNEFPQARLIPNTHNPGMGKASNQALQLCSGEYVLLVTPDTKCGKDSLEKMTGFMDEHPAAGGLSVRLISPQGHFIPESIHGLNPAWAAFFKLIGFAKHLVKTRLYDTTRKDWVEEFQIAEIDIIHGECMFLRRSALAEVGLFDERFTQYGYDIDLSYRLRLAGFKNFYFPKTYFFKYEDSQSLRFSWNKLKYFYGAMLIFALKYLLRLPDIKVQGIPQLYPASYEVKG
jgi:GT2 family glycosyltransferase